jgi:branched-chain amino acid transport system ATP-binding protein
MTESAATPVASAPASGDALLAVDDLHAGYLGIPAVRRLSLTVRAGEVVALLGPNGAGRTTTLSTIAGLLAPISGTVRLADDEITGRPAYRLARMGVALVPEDRALFYGLTVRENLRLARGERTLPQEELLEMLPELEKCLGRRADVLSGGEQQMLAVGTRAHQPSAAAAGGRDEPGPGSGDRGALELADRAYVLNHGELVLEGKAADLRGRRDLVEASYMGEATIDELAADTSAPAG